MDKMERTFCKNIKTFLNTFQNLGFTAHLTQQIKFLWSVSMTITLTKAKKENLRLFCTNILNSRTPKIRQVARLLGNITSTFPVATFGRLRYGALEKCKTMTLCKNNGNYNARTHLAEADKSDIRWWLENVNHLYNAIIVSNPGKCITTDASS